MIEWFVRSFRQTLRNLPLVLVSGGAMFVVPGALSGRTLSAAAEDSPIAMICFMLLGFGFVFILHFLTPVLGLPIRLSARTTPDDSLLARWRPTADGLGLTLRNVVVTEGSIIPAVALTGRKSFTIHVPRELLTEVPDDELDIAVCCALAGRLPAIQVPVVNNLVRFAAAFAAGALAWRLIPTHVLVVPLLALVILLYRAHQRRALEGLKATQRVVEGLGESPEAVARAMASAYGRMVRSRMFGPYVHVTDPAFNQTMNHLGHPEMGLSVQGSRRFQRSVLVVVGVMLGLLVLSVAIAVSLGSAN